MDAKGTRVRMGSPDDLTRVAAVSAEGRHAWLAVRRGPGMALWSFERGRELLRTTVVGDGLSPVFSKDGTRTAYSSMTGMVHVWDMQTDAEVASWRAHGNAAYACALSGDGRRLVTAGFDGKVALWRADRGELIREFRSSADAYWSVAISPDGSRVAAGTSESTVVLWEVAGGHEVGTLGVPGRLAPAEGTLAFSADGTALYLSGSLWIRWIGPTDAGSAPRRL